MKEKPTPKPLRFIASSLNDLRGFPDSVRQEMGQALFEAQCGFEGTSAKALKGFGGRGVLELIERHDGDTYRAAYTVRLAGSVYLLHAFQKKAKKGIATPKKDIDLIKQRLKLAEEDHQQRQKEGK